MQNINSPVRNSKYTLRQKERNSRPHTDRWFHAGDRSSQWTYGCVVQRKSLLDICLLRRRMYNASFTVRDEILVACDAGLAQFQKLRIGPEAIEERVVVQGGERTIIAVDGCSEHPQ